MSGASTPDHGGGGGHEPKLSGELGSEHGQGAIEETLKPFINIFEKGVTSFVPKRGGGQKH